MRGHFAPEKNSHRSASWQNSSFFFRPSLREAIQRLEAKGLLLRRQGGGTFVQSSLWQSFSDPLVELLSDHPESQFDLLETRHALEGIAAYYAALRSTDEDKTRIRELHHAIELAQLPAILTANLMRYFSIKLLSPKRHTM